jgi:hypothetical protein
MFKIASLALAASVAIFVNAPARALTTPCSPYTNIMGIASNLGGTAALIQTQMSNGDDFMFYASAGDGVIAFTVDGTGVKLLEEAWIEQDGTAVLTDDLGQQCKISCDDNGGLIVSVESAYFSSLAWTVSAYGVVSMADNVCGCSGSSMAPSQNVVCDRVACDNTAACRPGRAGYCQNGSLPN